MAVKTLCTNHDCKTSFHVFISRRNQRKIETDSATRKLRGRTRVRVATWPRRGSARTGSGLGPVRSRRQSNTCLCNHPFWAKQSRLEGVSFTLLQWRLNKSQDHGNSYVNIETYYVFDTCITFKNSWLIKNLLKEIFLQIILSRRDV